jgi:hypothetical protein
VQIELPTGVNVPSLPALDVRADLARVQWLQGRPSIVRPNDCLLYFGTSGGIALLLDVHRPQAPVARAAVGPRHLDDDQPRALHELGRVPAAAALIDRPHPSGRARGSGRSREPR